MELKQQHERILYPVVRIHTRKAGGSGTVIYSKPNPDKTEEYQTFILTCAHVIDDAITTKKDWDSLLKKKIEKEFLEQVSVELFSYVYLSTVDSSNSHRADIVAYDKHHDIAILKLDSPTEASYVAELIPKDQIPGVKYFKPTWTAGCSLLHDPFPNPGFITSMKEVFGNKLYWMGNGNSIFGNSGGAVFLAEEGWQIGLSAMITGIPADPFGMGISIDWMTWMGFFVPPQRIYEFLDEQELKFLYDPKDTYEAALKRREKKAKQAKLAMIAKDEGGGEEEPEEEPKDESPFRFSNKEGI